MRDGFLNLSLIQNDLINTEYDIMFSVDIPTSDLRTVLDYPEMTRPVTIICTSYNNKNEHAKELFEMKRITGYIEQTHVSSDLDQGGQEGHYLSVREHKF